MELLHAISLSHHCTSLDTVRSVWSFWNFCFGEGIENIVMKLICLRMETFWLVSLQSIISNYFMFGALRNNQQTRLSNDNEHNKQHSGIYFNSWGLAWMFLFTLSLKVQQKWSYCRTTGNTLAFLHITDKPVWLFLNTI